MLLEQSSDKPLAYVMGFFGATRSKKFLKDLANSEKTFKNFFTTFQTEG